MAGLDVDRRVIVSNGTDPRHVTAAPFPDRPAIGVVSGAAPGRGIETLVHAARLVRRDVPDLRLHLWLSAPTDAARAYVAELAETAAEPWIEIAPAPYETLGDALALATVLCVPHPPGEYLDAALPVKLFDSMAAGRPLVVTPRRETALVVERTGAGTVARGDRPEDLAEAIAAYLADPDFARRTGAAARSTAEREFDWRILGDRLAERVLAEVR
jgi:glycosyltransferase involved in cell wall biosynthesis